MRALLNAVLCLGLLALRPLTSAEPRPFKPDEHFPAGALAVVDVANIERLTEALGTTLVGRIATHPGTKEALGGLVRFLRAKLSENLAEFEGAIGMDILQALTLLRGQVSLAAYDSGTGGPPRLLLALELGPRAAQLRELFSKLDTWIASQHEGEDAPSLMVDGHPIALWQMAPQEMIGRVELGTHLVFAYPSDAAANVVLRYEGRPQGPKKQKVEQFVQDRGLKPWLEGLRGSAALSSGQLFFALDFAQVWRMAGLSDVPAPTKQEKKKKKKGITVVEDDEDGDAARPGESPGRRFLAKSGLERLESLAFSLGVRDGGVEWQLRLGMPKGLNGIVKEWNECLEPLGEIESLLRHVPVDVGSIVAARAKPERLWLQTQSLIETLGPEVAGPLGMVLAQLFGQVDVGDPGKVKDLPAIDIVAFGRALPGFGVLDESYSLSRDGEVQAHAKFLLGESAANPPQPSADPARQDLRRMPMRTIGRLSDGTWLFGITMSSLRRYYLEHSRAPRLGDDPAALRSVAEKLRQGRVVWLIRNEKQFLASWNTLVAAANWVAPNLEPWLSMVGVDLGLLPPAEEFLTANADGILRIDMDAQGVVLYGHRLESSSGVLVPIAVGSVLAGFLVPTLMQARGRAGEVACQNNLRELHKLCLLYGDSAGKGRLPTSAKGTLAGLQLLVEQQLLNDPRLVHCPVSPSDTAEIDENGKLRLTSQNCDYDLVPWSLHTIDPSDAIVAYDNDSRHSGRNVVFADSSVRFVQEDEFQRLLERDRARFANREDPSDAKKGAKKKTKKKAVAKEEE